MWTRVRKRALGTCPMGAHGEVLRLATRPYNLGFLVNGILLGHVGQGGRCTPCGPTRAELKDHTALR